MTRTSTARLFGALLGLALACFASFAFALHPKEFRNAEEEQRYRSVAKELRCVMCQNQSLADSPAGVADDLRLQVLTLIREGKSDREIDDYFVARYGKFILYRPRVEPVTWALWFGPFVLLLVGAAVIVVVLRRNAPGAPRTAQSVDEQEW